MVLKYHRFHSEVRLYASFGDGGDNHDDGADDEDDKTRLMKVMHKHDMIKKNIEELGNVQTKDFFEMLSRVGTIDNLDDKDDND